MIGLQNKNLGLISLDHSVKQIQPCNMNCSQTYDSEQGAKFKVKMALILAFDIVLKSYSMLVLKHGHDRNCLTQAKWNWEELSLCHT